MEVNTVMRHIISGCIDISLCTQTIIMYQVDKKSRKNPDRACMVSLLYSFDFTLLSQPWFATDHCYTKCLCVKSEPVCLIFLHDCPYGQKMLMSPSAQGCHNYFLSPHKVAPYSTTNIASHKISLTKCLHCL